MNNKNSRCFSRQVRSTEQLFLERRLSRCFLRYQENSRPANFHQSNSPPGELTPGKFPPGIFPLMFLNIPTRFFLHFLFFFFIIVTVSLILLKRLFCNSNVFKMLKPDLLQCIKKKNNYNLLLIILSQEIKNRQLYRQKSAGSNYFQMKFIYEK